MKVVHCKKEKYTVYAGRPSIFGNPFAIGKDGTREEVIAKYRKYALKNPIPKPYKGKALPPIKPGNTRCINCGGDSGYPQVLHMVIPQEGLRCMSCGEVFCKPSILWL